MNIAAADSTEFAPMASCLNTARSVQYFIPLKNDWPLLMDVEGDCSRFIASDVRNFSGCAVLLKGAEIVVERGRSRLHGDFGVRQRGTDDGRV